MKKLNFLHWVYILVAFAVASTALQNCNPKEKKPGTVLVTDTLSTLPIIDTTIIEDGIAPVAETPNARKNKEDKQKKEKVACGFGFQKFNNRKRPKEEAPGGIKGKPPKGKDIQPPTLNGGITISDVRTNQMTISWPPASDNKGVAGYDLFRDGVQINPSNITGTSYVDIGLTPATTYSYSYRAKDAAGNFSVMSGTVTGTTLSSPTDPPPPPPPPPTGSENVIYLNFLGKTITGTMWNAGSFTVSDAGLVQTEIDFITAQVQAHYPEFNVSITLNKAEYDAAAFGRKIEIIITESYEWFGQAGGVAYINSFFWTDGTPAFVFSLLLNYNSHNIAEAIAHEAGHTLGLRHQSDCDANGNIITQYSFGKTMGVSYYVPLGVWWTGTSSLSCLIQNDVEKLTGAIGLRQMAYIRNRNQSQYKF